MSPSNSEKSFFVPHLACRDLEKAGGVEPGAPDPARFGTRHSVISLHRKPCDGEGETKFNSLKGSWHWDIRTDTTFWSEQLYSIIGRENAPIPPFREHSCFHTSESWIRLVDATSELLEKGTAYELRLQMIHADGTRKWVIRNGEAVRDAQGNILELRGTVQQISEGISQFRKSDQYWHIQSNDDDTAPGLLQTYEAKNAELATKLRDNVCQRVSLLAAEMQSFRLTDPDLPLQAKSKLELFWQELAGILAELDQVSDRLYPLILDVLGLSFAMRRLCREFTREHGIPVEYSCSELVEHGLDKQYTVILYRVLEELLAEIAAHSNANHVFVGIDYDSGELRLRLRVSGNSLGFDHAKTEPAGAFGFARMKTQIGQTGGSVAVSSQQPRGALIEVRIPLAIANEVSAR